MKRILATVAILLLATTVYGASGSQWIEIKASINLPRSWTLATSTDKVEVEISKSVAMGRTWNLSAATDAVDVTPASPVAGDYLPTRLTDGTGFYSAKDRNWTLGTSTDKVEVEVSKIVSVGRTWNLGNATDNLLMYGWDGSANQKIAVDLSGQIKAVTAPEAGTNLKKSYVFSNIANTDAWIEVASYTVTTGKSLKIYTAKETALYAVETKIGDGTAGDEIFLACAPAHSGDNAQDERPVAKAAGTVITVYAKTAEATNSGTISWNGFEY